MAFLNQKAGIDRPEALLAVALIHILLAYTLIRGLAYEAARETSDRLTAFSLPEEMPPPPPPPPPETASASEMKALPLEPAAPAPSASAQPVPIVAPPPLVRLDIPSPVASIPAPAPVGPGTGASAGSSNAAGSGAGGTGKGSGSGGSGAGAGGGAAVKARLRSGYISSEDYPRSALREKAEGTSAVRYTVGTDGRVSGCTVTRSSGNAVLDAVTCSLIEKRFRFTPAQDAQGRPVPETLTKKYVWRLPL